MNAICCEKCGSNEFRTVNGYRVCAFCGTVFRVTPADSAMKSSTIALNDDVAQLLNKCRTDPKNARKYANLILDIDPDNKEALRYL